MKFLIFYTIIVFIFTTIVGNLLKVKNFKLDLKIKSFFQNENLRFVKTSMKHITSMGDVVTSLIIILPIFFYAVSEKKFVLATAILNSSLFNMIFLNLFKFLFRRERPVIKSDIKYWGYSFPSGHSCIGLSFYPTIMHILFIGHSSYYFWLIVGILFGLSIAISRIIVGVHWFSDVIFGSLIGSVFFLWTIYLYNIGFFYKFLF